MQSVMATQCNHWNIFCSRLYNKDAILEYLLDKSPDKTPMEAASHIKSIKVNCLCLIGEVKIKC